MDKVIKKGEVGVTNIILLEVTHFLFKRLGAVEVLENQKSFNSVIFND